MELDFKVGDLVIEKGAEPWDCGWVSAIEGGMAWIDHIDIFQGSWIVSVSELELCATSEEMDLCQKDREAGEAAIAARVKKQALRQENP